VHEIATAITDPTPEPTLDELSELSLLTTAHVGTPSQYDHAGSEFPVVVHFGQPNRAVRAAQRNATEGVSFRDDRLTYAGREFGEPGSVNGAAESTRFTRFGSLAPPFVGGERDGRRRSRATQEG
jgi:hypothetical protein